jgi:hypothetical protein
MAAPHAGGDAKHACSGAKPVACQARGARGGVTVSGRLYSSVRLDIMASRAARPGHAAPGAARLALEQLGTDARALGGATSCNAAIAAPVYLCTGMQMRPGQTVWHFWRVCADHAWLAYSTPSTQPAAPAGSLATEASDCGYQSCIAWPVSSLSTVMQTACHSAAFARGARAEGTRVCASYASAELSCTAVASGEAYIHCHLRSASLNIVHVTGR